MVSNFAKKNNKMGKPKTSQAVMKRLGEDGK
jgi:hypothetical protein